MPHDLNGKLLHVGDLVNVQCKVTAIHKSHEYCNLSVETINLMPPYTSTTHIALNTRQVTLQEE